MNPAFSSCSDRLYQLSTDLSEEVQYPWETNSNSLQICQASAENSVRPLACLIPACASFPSLMSFPVFLQSPSWTYSLIPKPHSNLPSLIPKPHSNLLVSFPASKYLHSYLLISMFLEHLYLIVCCSYVASVP